MSAPDQPFKITRPGKYRMRNGEIANIARITGTFADEENNKRCWYLNGARLYRDVDGDTTDIIAGPLDEPATDIGSVIHADLMTRAEIEQIMRDLARREGKDDIATMHSDRALAFVEAASAAQKLCDEPYVTPTPEEIATHNAIIRENIEQDLSTKLFEPAESAGLVESRDLWALAERAFENMANDPEVWLTHGCPGVEKRERIIEHIAKVLTTANLVRQGEQIAERGTEQPELGASAAKGTASAALQDGDTSRRDHKYFHETACPNGIGPFGYCETCGYKPDTNSAPFRWELPMWCEAFGEVSSFRQNEGRTSYRVSFSDGWEWNYYRNGAYAGYLNPQRQLHNGHPPAKEDAPAPRSKLPIIDAMIGAIENGTCSLRDIGNAILELEEHIRLKPRLTLPEMPNVSTCYERAGDRAAGYVELAICELADQLDAIAAHLNGGG